MQETFLKAWQHLDSFRGDGCFEGWLIRICRNTIYDLSDRERRRPTAGLAEVERTEPTTTDDGMTEIWDLVEHLPLDQREAVVLVTVLGYSYEDAGAVLDVPVGTVRSRVHRGRARLTHDWDEALAVA